MFDLPKSSVFHDKKVNINSVTSESVTKTTKYLTHRGRELIDVPGTVIRLTVENYIKWYCLYLLYPDGSIQEAHKAQTTYDWDGWFDHYLSPVAFISTASKYSLEVTQEAFNAVCEMFVDSDDNPHRITDLIPDSWDYTHGLYLIRNDFKVHGREYYSGDVLKVTAEGSTIKVEFPFTNNKLQIDKNILVNNCEHILGTNYY